MKFFQLLEQIHNNRDVNRLARSIFGNCGYEDDEEYSTVDCDFSNRILKLRYVPSLNTVNIEFYWQQVPRNFSNKDLAGNVAGQELQPGTMEGIDKFRKFFAALKEMDVGVSFSASGRRQNLYSRVLSQVGFEPTSTAGNIWR